MAAESVWAPAKALAQVQALARAMVLGPARQKQRELLTAGGPFPETT